MALGVLLAIVLMVIWARNSADTTGGGSHSADAAHSSAVVTPAPVKPSTPAASPSSSPSPSTSPSTAASTAVSSPPPSSQAPSSPPATPGTPAVPAGYHLYKDNSGFSIAVPDGFGQPSAGSDSRTFRGSNGTTLMVAWTNDPKPDALKEWQSVEQGSSFPNYHRVAMTALKFRQWTNAADWEWTFTGNSGSPMHASERGFVTGKYGYTIYWTMLDSEWNLPQSVEARKNSYDSFQPAP